MRVSGFPGHSHPLEQVPRGIQTRIKRGHMWIRVAQGDQIGGWSVSLVLHLTLLSVIWPALQQLPAPVLTEPFRWNVTLVQTQQPNATVMSPGEESLPHQDFRAVDAATQKPAPPRPPRPSLDRSPSNENRMPAHPVAATRSATATVPAQTSPNIPDAAPPTSSITEPMPASQESPPMPHEMADQTQRLVARAPVQAGPTSTALPREVEALSPPAPVRVETPAVMHEPSAASPGPPAPVPSTASSVFSDPRADYSWLQRA